MMPRPILRRAAFAARVLLVVTLLLSSVGKAIAPGATVRLIADWLAPYGVPAHADTLRGVVLILSGLEVGLALWVATRARPYPLVATASFLFIVTIPLVDLIFRGVSVVDCGCFGTLLPSFSAPMAVARNVLLIGVSLWAVYAVGASKAAGASLKT